MLLFFSVCKFLWMFYVATFACVLFLDSFDFVRHQRSFATVRSPVPTLLFLCRYCHELALTCKFMNFNTLQGKQSDEQYNLPIF